MPLMQQRHFIYLADEVAPLLAWPTQITAMAEKLAATNPKFDTEKFTDKHRIYGCTKGEDWSKKMKGLIQTFTKSEKEKAFFT